MVDNKNNNIRLSTANSLIEETFSNKLIVRCLESDESTSSKSKSIVVEDDFTNKLFDKFSDFIIKNYRNETFLYKKDSVGFINLTKCPRTYFFRVVGTREFIKEMEDRMDEISSKSTSGLFWVYNASGDSLSVRINRVNMPCTLMYPWLKEESLETYYDRFYDSNSNVIILQGSPGSGKSTFIKGLLNHRETNGHVVYDPLIMETDTAFIKWYNTSSSTFLILEDADVLLKSRERGNDMMHRILNLADGIMSFPGKKIVFSTNLPNLKDLDAALTRVGRCFDVVNFDKLTKAQAQALADSKSISLPDPNQTEYTIAEVFNDAIGTDAVTKSEFGFNQ